MTCELRTLRNWQKIDATDVGEAMKQGGLDWETREEPVWSQDKQKNFRVFKGKRIIVRDDIDKEFSVVGKNYHPLSNYQAFSIFQPFIDNGMLTLERAGCIGDGISTFILGDLNGNWSIGNQEMKVKVALSNNYSGRKGVRYSVIPVVDGIYMPVNVYGMKQTWTFWHVHSLVKNLEKAQDALQYSYDYANHFCEYAEGLRTQSMTRLDAREFFNQLHSPKPNEGNRGRKIREGKVADLLASWDSLDPDCKSKWGLLQAIANVEMEKAGLQSGETDTSLTFRKRNETLLKKMLDGNIPTFTKAEKMLN